MLFLCMLNKIKELFKEIPGRCTLYVECKDFEFSDVIRKEFKENGFDTPPFNKESISRSIEEGKDCSSDFQFFEGNIIIKYGK